MKARLNGANRDLRTPCRKPYKQRIISLAVIDPGPAKNADSDRRVLFLSLFSDLLFDTRKGG